MNVHVLSRAALLSAVALGWFAAEVNGAIVYRETFGTATVGGQEAAQPLGWQIHLHVPSSGVITDNSASTAAVAAINRNANASKPGTTDTIGQVNAGPTVGDPPAAYGQGIPFSTAANPNVLIWTNEYATTSGTGAGIDPAAYVPGSLVFKWYQGNAATTSNWRVALRTTGDQWYASETTFANNAAVTSIANFGMGDDNGDGGTAHGAELKSLSYASTNWLPVTFDGTTLALSGGPSVPALPGPITAFGMFSDTPGTGNRRFDTYTIEGELIPEPAGAVALCAAWPLLARHRRRRTQA